MTDTKIFGIKNCDTMKKAMKWLESNQINSKFYDYKKEGANEDVLSQAIAEHGWENVINRRGTTWRQLPEDVKNNMSEERAMSTAKDNPSIIKRPLLAHNGKTYLGFKEDQYKEIFKVAS